MHVATIERQRRIVADIIKTRDHAEINKRIGELELLEPISCVIRSFESVLAVPATLDEMRMRKADMEEVMRDVDQIPVPWDLEMNARRNRLIHSFDQRMIRRFVERVSVRSSPFGDALRRHDISFHEMIAPTIIDQLQNDQHLLLGLNLPQRHLAHVRYIFGEVLRVSDYDEVVRLDEKREYHTILITPI